MVLLLSALTAFLPAFAPQSHDHCGESLTVPLLAGQTTPVGSVIVTNSEDTLFLFISMDAGWSLKETHAAVACRLADIPQTKTGNPIPGRFPYKHSFASPVQEDLYTLPLSAYSCRDLTIAVHASVVRRGSSTTILQQETAWAAGDPFPGRNWATYFKYTVQECEPDSLAGLFRTQGQGGWGARPQGHNPGTYLVANFDEVFPAGLTVGTADGNQVLFTSGAAILDFLPQGGTAAPLTGDAVDPTDLGNVLAGQTTALTLNVFFDMADPDFGASDVLLAGLVVADETSPCFGMTVWEVLEAANGILGGGSYYDGAAAAAINECVSRINENFDNGTVDEGFLKLP